VVLTVNGRPIRDGGALRNAVGLLEVGEVVRLDILRDGKPQTIDAKVGEYVPAKTDGETLNPRLAGATFEDIGPNSRLAEKVKGVLVANVESGSPAARTGLRKSDVIIAVNRQAISSTAELKQLAADSDGLLLNLLRGREELLLVLR
jgi:S1-C subfamily serine protease